METNEIMENEEVVETAEEIMEASSGKSLKIVAGVGAAVAVGVIVYKYVAKPAYDKYKRKKKLRLFEKECSDNDSVADEEEFEEA